MNWGEIKLATLKKIDPSYDSLTPNRNTNDYLNAMVEAANRGLQDLVTVGKFIVKSYEIIQNPIENELGDMTDVYQHLNDDVYYEAVAKAYSFDVDAPSVITIYVDGVLFKTITHTTNVYTNYRGTITNPSDLTVKINFGGSYPYQYTNVALYDVTFASDAAVWQYGSQRKYNLKTLLTDFYKLSSNDVVMDNPYHKTQDYFWEGDSTLVLDGSESGRWTVHYFAYPEEITSSTATSTELSIAPELAALLPIYMASELYFEESPSKATQFRNQYEAGKSQLRPSEKFGRARFVDKTGWI